MRVALQATYGKAFHFWRSIAAVKDLNARAIELLDQVGLAGSRDLLASNSPTARSAHSKLQRRWRSNRTCCCSMNRPQAWAMKTSSRSPASSARSRKDARFCLWSTNLSVVSTLCDRVTVLQHGQIIADGSYNAVSRDPLVRTAYMGEEDA